LGHPCRLSATLLLEGRTWLVAPGQAPLLLEAGDSVILPRGTASGAYLILSAPDAQPYPVEDLWRQAALQPFDPKRRTTTRPRRIRWGGWGTDITRLVSLAFGIDDVRLKPLIEALPERMVVRRCDVNGDFMRSLLGCWSDPRIARVLIAIYRAPQERWTLERLASVACMSRSVFAKRFIECTGQSPAFYVCAWRVQLARDALHDGKSIKELTRESGYQSEAAFRAAFRRAMRDSHSVVQRT
jgi:AraC-like DNA-binding protein